MLRDSGLAAPKIIQADADKGLMILEDFGDALMARVCRDLPSLEKQCYEVAVDVLTHLHRTEPPLNLPPYDMVTYLREANLLVEWYLPSVTGTATSPQSKTQFEQLIASACLMLSPTSPVLVMRDYHSENLLWLPDRDGVSRIGLLDFQDALAGHPAYDLVSLLEDARRDTTPELQRDMKARYVTAMGINEAEFEAAYCILGAQRNLKIVGIFARLCIRDGKFTYPDLIPRVWGHLMRDLSHPKLEDLRDWVAMNVPEPTSQNLQRIKDQCDVA